MRGGRRGAATGAAGRDVMLEIGWSEILVIAVVAIVVFPSKDLPKLLRTVGQTVGKLRRMAGDFQSQFSAALREAEREVDLEDTRKQLQDLKSANPLSEVKKALDPLRNAGEDMRREIRNVGNPMSDPRPPAGVVAVPNEPVKTGPAEASAPVETTIAETSVPAVEAQPAKPSEGGAA